MLINFYNLKNSPMPSQLKMHKKFASNCENFEQVSRNVETMRKLLSCCPETAQKQELYNNLSIEHLQNSLGPLRKCSDEYLELTVEMNALADLVTKIEAIHAEEKQQILRIISNQKELEWPEIWKRFFIFIIY